jgi:hypothetical protein
MKNIRSCLVFFLLFASCQAFAQSAFEDARELAKYISVRGGKYYLKQDSASVRAYMPYLTRAAGLPNTARMFEVLDKLATDKNPFLSDDEASATIIIPNNFQNISAAAPVMGAQKLRDGAGQPAVFSVTNLADGIAKFLVTRTKEELSIAFFRDFQEKVVENVYLRTLFPNTADLLRLIDRDIYQYKLYLDGLRNNFSIDLKALPVNTKILLQSDNELTRKLEPEMKIIAEDAIDLARALLDERSPDSLLRFFALETAMQRPERVADIADPKRRNLFADMAAGFKIVHLLSESLRDTDGDEIWAKASDIRSTLRSEPAMYLYLGLMWRQTAGVSFSNGQTMQNALGRIAGAGGKTAPMRSIVDDFAGLGQSLKSVISATARRQRDTMDYETWRRYLNDFTGMLQIGTRFKADLLGLPRDSAQADARFISTLRHLNDLHFDVRQRHYSAAVNDLVLVLTNLLGEKFTFRGQLLKYGHFMANVAMADNSDQVAAAIEAVALPVGSAQMKKENVFSVTINAYTGLGYGRENLQLTGNKNYAGVSAPVGIGFNWGLKSAGSLSLYTSVIDVGALAAFRFNDPLSDNLPELKWGNILAPGAHLAYGSPWGLPLTLGAGAQLGPNLRAIKPGLIPGVVTDSGWRFGVFLSVDIPVFSLYVR